mmetsp:Transcript_11406/g.27063  ORF Transcript_11406/g.27063 Transcript_11406/m.27063 type:complete len:264 (-) Transcript_11406:101-892(-)
MSFLVDSTMISVLVFTSAFWPLVSGLDKRYEVDDRFPGWKGEVADVQDRGGTPAETKSGAAKVWGFGSTKNHWRGEVSSLSWEPRVFRYSGFLSASECAALREMAANSGSAQELELHDTDDPLVKTVSERVSGVTFMRRGSLGNLEVQTVPRGSGLSHSLQHTPTAESEVSATLIINLADSAGEVALTEAPPVAAEGEAWGRASCDPDKPSVALGRGDALLVYHKRVDNSPDHGGAFAVCSDPRASGHWAVQRLLTRRGSELF